MDMLASQVWHYWLAVPLFAGAVLALVATIVGYLVKVGSARYPREEQ
jgi:hypothetical protein